MTPRNFNKAVEEARRFLAAAETLKEQLEGAQWFFVRGKASAAVRRASMDLTRSLADLRRSF